MTNIGKSAQIAFFMAMIMFFGKFASADEAAGKAFAEANCSRCHSIGRTDESKLSTAPAFRELHKRYPIESLAESLAEGMVTGHPEMPEVQLDPEGIDSLLNYIRSLALAED